MIIPYQELLGNYDVSGVFIVVNLIIPYQELLGNYDYVLRYMLSLEIIPYQELLGNYDTLSSLSAAWRRCLERLRDLPKSMQRKRVKRLTMFA